MPLGGIVYVLVGLLAAGALGISWWKGYGYGVERSQAQIAEQAQIAGKLRADLANAQAAAEEASKRLGLASEKVRIEYRDRVRTVKEKAAPEIIERIRIETLACPVSPSLVGLWNTPDQDSPGKPPTGANASSTSLAPAVSQAELGEAVAEAKRRFTLNTIQLEALQNWAKEVERATQGTNLHP